jgi:RimJ/RimL family protein N-acetyltransferase
LTVTLPITTERLILRRFTHDDIPDVIAFVSHPSVARATPEIEGTKAGVGKYIDLQNSYEPFELDRCFDLAVERKEDGKVIGLLSLVCREHKQGEIGYALGLGYRGQGYATEAARALMTYGFASLGLYRIYATTSSVNAGSWGVMERLGMRREGHLREAESRDGEWVDTLIYGVLAREWQEAGGASSGRRVNVGWASSL